MKYQIVRKPSPPKSEFLETFENRFTGDIYVEHSQYEGEYGMSEKAVAELLFEIDKFILEKYNLKG